MKIHTQLLVLFMLPIASLFAQDCSTFYPLQEGATFEIETHNKRGKLIATTRNTVAVISTSSGNTEAIIKSIMLDKRGDVLTDGNYNILCDGTGISIDVNSLISPQLLQQFEGMETDISGTNVVLPNELIKDQNLPDAEVNMSIDMSGIAMNMNVKMTDRIVLGQEEITTPAGTFNCYVIEYTSHLKMGMTRKGKSKQWIAKGIGLVKQEDYNNNNRVTSSSLLVKFSI